MPTSADTTTRPGVDRRPLMSYLRVQRYSERRMIAILRRTYERISRELRLLEARPGIGAAVRRDQLILTQAAIQREVSTLWTALGREVLAGKAAAAAAGIEANYPPALLRRVMPAADVDTLIQSAKASASRGFEAVEARLKISRIPLAESVYKNRELTSGKIDAIVDEALTRGASARELAKDVRAFIHPDVRGGVRYAAMRLGRTELNNSFHALQVQSGIDAPWTEYLRWNLSGSHPEPDECDEYAEASTFAGGAAGLWKPEEVPRKPHPNCLCFTTPETVSSEEFIEQYMAGAYDDFVDAMIQNSSTPFR